jgi:hypothetical protein
VALPALRTNGWISVPWAEHVTRAGGLIDMSAGYGAGNQASYTIRINFDDLDQAVRDLLGENTIAGNARDLNRRLPVQHPHRSHLWADRISSIRPLRWNSKVTGYPGSYSRYDYWIVTIIFTQPKYRIYSDAFLDHLYGYPRQEWQRFVEPLYESAGEFLQRQGTTSFKWAEGGGGTQPTSGDPFPNSVGQFLGKAELILRWHKVPRDGLFSKVTEPGDGPPTNLNGVIGKVNDASFLGYATGTLLLRPPRFTALESPIDNGGLGFFEPEMLYTVDLPIAIFDPPHTNSSYQGHNLAPWSDGTWYLVKDLKTGTKTIFESADFKNIFKMNR